MSSFNVSFGDSTIPVQILSPQESSSNISKQELESFPPFKTWSSTLARSLALQSRSTHVFHKDPYTLKSITVQSVDRFGGSRLGFVKLKAEITNGSEEHLPGSVFLRGGSVGMLVILQADDAPRDSEEGKHVLLTVQPRIPAGSLNLAELPAGMLDDSGTFGGAAAKEIKEELNMDIKEDELTDMTAMLFESQKADSSDQESLQRGVYTSPGGSDEFVPLFLYQKRVPRGSLKEWQGKLTGLRSHGEKITLKLVDLQDMWKEGARDAKALSAWSLYEGLRREGRLSSH